MVSFSRNVRRFYLNKEMSLIGEENLNVPDLKENAYLFIVVLRV